MSTKIIENIDSQQLSDALSERYLSYAVSTIVSRALPDVRDGLKPVHRRILYSMLRQKLSPAAAFRKCATVVGDVLGHYHPHGDSSVYDAMVRLAQDFSVRYPLIDGQGNFGNIDGDPQAAYRYTESKMTDAAMMIMEGLDEDSVDMMPNFDGTTVEPSVMPGAFPNLLANGGMGIAGWYGDKYPHPQRGGGLRCPESGGGQAGRHNGPDYEENDWTGFSHGRYFNR